ncbi:hypothetical protein Poli38472_003621 [Pythium oligandrum]|uniref:Uncharacterized protein n=1 Tax=Pythium oligandrum TaxID=41045 RepID=A0A8K1CLJ3_PYTOL|nr:hypothetical protein Poli38472_003621 [Pythium oligandrum]|eukprot:TMW65856.1 hypothetical protein Poli38472_003621 [Pythium oligandrum]
MLTASFLFEEEAREQPNQRRCVVCGEDVVQELNTGYDNLLQHLVQKHKGFRQVVEQCIETGKTKATPMMFPKVDEGTAKTLTDASLDVSATKATVEATASDSATDTATAEDASDATATEDAATGASVTDTLTAKADAIEDAVVATVTSVVAATGSPDSTVAATATETTTREPPAPRPRSEFFTTKDVRALLLYVEEVCPIGKRQWDRVQELYNEKYAKPNNRIIRPTSSIYAKYNNLLAIKAPDDQCSPEVREARELKQRLREARLHGESRTSTSSTPQSEPVQAQAFPLLREILAKRARDEQSNACSDDETIPDEEMAAIAAADPDFVPEPESNPSQRKRSRLTEANLLCQDLHEALLARVLAMESSISTLQREVVALNDSVKTERLRNNFLQGKLAEYRTLVLLSTQNGHIEDKGSQETETQP